MYRNQLLSLVAALTLSLSLVACAPVMTPGSGSQAIGGVCQQSSDCQPGLECEVEHGAGSCQMHGGGGGKVDDHGKVEHDGGEVEHPDGSEVEHPDGSEVEHPDGSKVEHPDGGDDDGGGLGGGAKGCASNADCAVGEECQVEPGGNYCKPHGGKGK